jgi:Dolichyl-phosphate-mannose-protein mannosyltransferase
MNEGRPSRWMFAALGAILAAHLALLVHCAVRKSTCYDEGAHLAAGLAYLRHGEMSIYNQSPPLVRMWAAVPAYLAGAETPLAKRHRGDPPRSRHWIYFDEFQQLNLANLHRYVLWGRFMLIPASLAAGYVVFLWGRRLYGDLAGLIACAAWSFSPTVIAHGSTLGTDMPMSLAMLLSVAAWTWFARSGSLRAVLIASLAIALAHTIKFTALLLWPVLLGISLVLIFAGKARWRTCLTGGLLAIVVTFVVFNAAYGFRLMFDRLDQFDFDSQTMQRVQRVLPGGLPVPFHRDMMGGFDAQKWEAEGVYVTPLFGEGHFGGDWRYYPWLILTKTTAGGLALLVLGLISFAVRRPRIDELPLLVLAIGVALGMTLAAQINIGIRYLLPLYAPVIILLSRSTAIPRFKPIALLLACAIAVESLLATPRFHSFCNVIVQPWRAQVPDLDWGQSLIELREWMQANGQDRIGLLYFGSVDPAAYGITSDDPTQSLTSEYIAIARPYLDGLPVRGPDGFVFVRPWRRLRDAPVVAELGGIIVFRSSEVAGERGSPWVVRIGDWQEALGEPELLPVRNFNQRHDLGD